MANSNPPAERFWSKVDRRGPDECWPWTGAIAAGGYGRFKFGGHKVSAHRVAFQLANGREPYPFALHHCDNRVCCNPAHLWEGDHYSNMRDMTAKGRAGGSRRPPKTHCPQGHEYTPENTYVHEGSRHCRHCGRIRDARRAPARKEARISA